jgi:hypothetical protein
MFRTVPLSIVRSSSLSTQQMYVSYRFAKLVHLVFLIKRNYKINTKYKRTQKDQIEVIKFVQENKSK